LRFDSPKLIPYLETAVLEECIANRMQYWHNSSASMLPAGNILGALYHSCNTQSSAPEDGRDHCPKHVELIGIINKPLLLHLVGVYII